METENPSYYNELAIASLTVGIASFIQLFGLERSIIAIVFGVLALKRIKQDQSQRGKRMAIAGIILGAVWTFIALMMMPHAIKAAKELFKAIKP